MLPRPHDAYLANPSDSVSCKGIAFSNRVQALDKEDQNKDDFEDITLIEDEKTEGEKKLLLIVNTIKWVVGGTALALASYSSYIFWKHSRDDNPDFEAMGEELAEIGNMMEELVEISPYIMIVLFLFYIGLMIIARNKKHKRL